MPIATYAINQPSVMAQKVADMMITIGGAIVVVGWVTAGILYLLAAGAPEKMGTAKKALIASIIGTILVIVASATFTGISTFLAPIIGT